VCGGAARAEMGEGQFFCSCTDSYTYANLRENHANAARIKGHGDDGHGPLGINPEGVADVTEDAFTFSASKQRTG
jgi:hypothetical protein